MRFFICEFKRTKELKIFPEMFEILNITPEEYFKKGIYKCMESIIDTSNDFENCKEINLTEEELIQLEEDIINKEREISGFKDITKISILNDLRKHLKNIKRKDKNENNYKITNLSKEIKVYENENDYLIKLIIFKYYKYLNTVKAIFNIKDSIILKKYKNKNEYFIVTNLKIKNCKELPKHEVLFNSDLNIDLKKIKEKIIKEIFNKDLRDNLELISINYILEEIEKGNI